MADRRVTARGFRIYLADHPGCQDAEVTVVESSIAFEGAHVRIYHGDDEHVQIHVDAAEAVAHALLDFAREARAGLLTEPAYRDGGEHGHKGHDDA